MQDRLREANPVPEGGGAKGPAGALFDLFKGSIRPLTGGTAGGGRG